MNSAKGLISPIVVIAIAITTICAQHNGSLPPIKYIEHEFKNGLPVNFHEERSTPIPVINVLSQVGSNNAQTAQKELAAKIDEYLTRTVPFGFSGVALLSKNGEIILKKGYGLADRKMNIPFTPETVYNIESVTKQFTAAAILKLEEQGKLSTNDVITKYFDNVPEDKAGITLHQLLTHTAGLLGMNGLDEEAITRDAAVQRILASKLLSAPGVKWYYSNPGYSLLTVIVEKVSGQPYERFVNEQLLRPAKLTSTGYAIPKWNRKKIARAYSGVKDLGIPQDQWTTDGPWWNLRGGGGFLSTVEDMYRWHLALKNNLVLSDASYRKATTPYVMVGSRQGVSYGYAWFISKNPEGKLLVEHGGDGMFMAEFRRYLDEDMVFILGINHQSRDRVATPVRRQAVRILSGGEYKLPPPVNMTLSSKELQKYAGTYALPSGLEFDVIVDGGQLFVDMRSSGAAKLFVQLPNEQNAERLHKVSPIITKVVQGMARRDFEPLREVLPRNLKIENEKRFWTDEWSQLEKEFGAFKSAEVLGEYPTNNSSEIYVLINFERAGQIVRFAQTADGQWDIYNNQTPLLPAFYRFAPQSKTEFVGYNFGNSTEVRINFQINADGKVNGFTASGKASEMTARKIR